MSSQDCKPLVYEWRFTDSPHTGVFTTKRVISGEDVVTRVFHDRDDGAWQFHGPGESKPADATYVCFHHIIDNDRSIEELVDLPIGWCAWREDRGSPWKRELYRNEDD